MKKAAAVRKVCLSLCSIAVLLSAACMYHFIGRYTSARQKTAGARQRYAALKAVLSGKEIRSLPVLWDLPIRGDRVDLRSYAVSAAGEIERLAVLCGVEMISLHAGVSVAVPGTAVLEPEVAGSERELRSFISAIEASLYVFTVNKARIIVSPAEEGRLTARFGISSAADIPPNAGSDPSNAVELILQSVPDAACAGHAADEERNLFAGSCAGYGITEGRSGVPADPGETGGVEELKLTGILRGKTPAAFIQDISSGRDCRLYPGQYINGFRLERVMDGKVVLAKEGKLYELYF